MVVAKRVEETAEHPNPNPKQDKPPPNKKQPTKSKGEAPKANKEARRFLCCFSGAAGHGFENSKAELALELAKKRVQSYEASGAFEKLAIGGEAPP